MTKKKTCQVLNFLGIFLITNFSFGSQEQAQSSANLRSQFPLHEAMAAGDINRINLLIGIAADARDNSQQTPLHVAAKNGNLKGAQCVVKYGASVDTRDNQGNTPLHLACKYGHIEVARCLLQAAPDIEARDTDEESSNEDEDSLEKDYESLDEDDDSLDEDDTSPNEDRGLVNTKNNAGNTPLHLACENGHLAMAQFLLETGADIEAHATLEENPEYVFGDAYWKGPTALSIACNEGHAEIAKLLIRRGADVDAQDRGNYSRPLYRAIENGHFDIVQQLIEAGADTDDIGHVDRAIALHYAATGPNPEIVKFFIHETPEDIETQDKDGNTPLHWAAQWNFLHNAELLLSAGAEIKLNVSHYTPLGLLLYAYGGGENCFATLLEIPRGSSEENDYTEWVKEIRPTVQFFVELDMNNISTETRALLDRLYPEHRTWLAGRKKFVNKLFEESLQLPSDIAQLLHEFIFNVEKKRKRDAETDQESTKKSRTAK